MNRWTRYRLTTGFRQLGHSPKWTREPDGTWSAYCRRCVWAWGFPAGPVNVPQWLRASGVCARKTQR